MDKFSKYNTKTLLGDLNIKEGGEYIFRQTIENESLHIISNDNEVWVINFATSKKLIVKSTMFSHRNTNLLGNTHN